MCLICNKSIKRKKKVKCFSCQRQFHIPCLEEVHKRAQFEMLFVEHDLWNCDYCVALANVEEEGAFSEIFSFEEIIWLSENFPKGVQSSSFAPLIKAAAVEPAVTSKLMQRIMHDPQNLLSPISSFEVQKPVIEANIPQSLSNSKYIATGHFFYTLDVLHEGKPREWICFPACARIETTNLSVTADFPYVNCVQEKGDLVIFHPSFCKFIGNSGFSISERLNFAPTNWLKFSLDFCCQNRHTKKPPMFSLIEIGMVLYAKATYLNNQTLKNDCLQLFEQIFSKYNLSFAGFLLKYRSKVSIISSGLNFCKECNAKIPHIRLECNKCKVVFCSICIPQAETPCKACEGGKVYVKISSRLFRFLNTVENV